MKGSCALALIFAGLSGVASADWTFSDLDPGSGSSIAQGVSNGNVVGSITTSGLSSAALWSGPGYTLSNLTPSGASYASANGAFGEFQAGSSEFSASHAGFWNGSASSWVDLNPSGASSSGAIAMGDGVEGGYVSIGGVWHASMWSGTADSWIDLSGGHSSFVHGVTATQEAGATQVDAGSHPPSHASLWSGSAASWVDLSPAGSTSSEVDGISGSQEAGYAIVGGASHAGMWSGTAGSWIDLNPTSALSSSATAISNGYVAGSVDFSGPSKAVLWNGSADDYVDLSALLPAGQYSRADAYGLDVGNGGEIWVVGQALTSNNQSFHAVVWHYSPVPEPASLGALALGLIGLARRRRRTQ